MNLSSYGLTGESGRLAVWLSSDVLGADDQESDRLYRYALASRPELNRMHTAIDMNNNNLNNVATVNAKTGTFTENVTAKNGNFSEGVTAKNGTFSENINAKNGAFSQGITTGSDIRSNDGWLITQNSKGWMNATHGGGWYMSDDDWMRSLNNKNIYTGGQVRGGTVRSDGRISTGEFLQLDAVATEGTRCSPDGLVGRDASGGILSCQSGVWGKLGADEKVTTYSSKFPYSKVDMGPHAMCALSYVRVIKIGYDDDTSSCEISKSGSNWILTSTPAHYSNFRCDAVCLN